MTQTQQWTTRPVEVQTWNIPLVRQSVDHAIEVRLSPASFSAAQHALIDNGDILPAYIHAWVRVAERLHLDADHIPCLAIMKRTPRWFRQPLETWIPVDFGFCDVLELLSDTHARWALCWRGLSSPIDEQHGCMIPASEHSIVICGREETVAALTELIASTRVPKS